MSNAVIQENVESKVDQTNEEVLDKCLKVFNISKLMLSVLGIYPDKLNDVQFFIHFAIYFYHIILMYTDLFMYITSLEHVILNLIETMAFSQITLKMIFLRLHNNDLGEVIREARKDFNAKDYSKEEIETFISYHVKSDIFMKLFVGNTFICAYSYYVKPLLGQLGDVIAYAGSKDENATIVFIIPYQFYLFYEINDAATYFWTYASQFSFVTIGFFAQTASDCLLITVVYHISGQLAVLALRIAKINTDPMKSTKDLFKIVKSHIRLLRMGKLVGQAYSGILLAHLVGATALVCVLGYQILLLSALGQLDGATIISLFSFLFLVLLLLFAQCAVGENLLTESERVSEAFYNCYWYNMTKENCQIVILCIARSQKPLQLTAGKFSRFCLQTFTDSVKASMGYLSVLRSFM